MSRRGEGPTTPSSPEGADNEPSPPAHPTRTDTSELERLNRALQREVAERKRFEDDLRRSEAFLGAVLGALSSRIAVLDAKGTIIAVNTAWERQAGADPLGSLVSGLGANYLEACEAAGTDDAARVARGAREVLTGQRSSLSLEYADPQGRWQALRITAFDTVGQRRLVLEIEDISKRKDAEEALLQSIERTQRVLESAVDGILTIDDRGRVESMNPAAESIFGYSANEVLGRNVSMLMPNPYHREHDGYLERYLATGEARIIGIGREVVGLRKDGSTFPMDLAVSEFRLDGRRSFLGSVRDITERKEVDEALRRERDFAERLVDTTQAIVLVLDLAGHILRFNRYLEEISAVALSEVQGAPWFETFVPEGQWSEQRRQFRAALAGEPQGSWQGSLRTRNGELRRIEWTASRLSAADGAVVGILWTGQDITDRLELESQLRQAQKMEAIGQLAGGVAHDFNTLLGSILGYSEMLATELDDDDPKRRPVEQIHRGAQRGAALTRQLLAFSRRQVLQPTRVDLNGVLDDMSDMLRRLIRENVDLVFDPREGLGTVEVDVGQIEQVVLNLVVNAADAITGSGRIDLKTLHRELGDNSPTGLPAGSYVGLAVDDTGCGMDDEVRRRAFDPFFTTKEPGKGTGLGLSTVYGIVRQSEGSIELKSTPGEGTRVEVLLPRIEHEATPTSSPGPPTQGVLASGSERVLLVEDDAMFRELLTDVLEAQGYTVVDAEDPQECLALCAEGDEPDILISDLVMPGMSGSELAQVLLERHPAMRVVLMSGYSDAALEDRDALALAHAFLQKPFSTHDFVRTIREVLESDRPESETTPPG